MMKIMPSMEGCVQSSKLTWPAAVNGPRRQMVPRKPMKLVAAVGPGWNQPLPKQGALNSRAYQQQSTRPRPELCNEAHVNQGGQVHVADRDTAVQEPADSHANTPSNGQSNGYSNGYANGASNDSTAAPLGAGVAVLDPPKQQLNGSVANGILNSAKAHGLLPAVDDNARSSTAVRTSAVPADCKKVRVSSSQVLAFVLGGGQGSELYPLTKSRAEPAVPLFGSYRLIDVPVSNCLNSTVPINKVYVLTQYNSTPLNRHLAVAYNCVNSLQFSNDMSFVEPLNATLTNMKEKDKDWFQGTADAVRHYAWTLQDPRLDSVQEVVILSGDQIYRMDYTELIQYHRHTKADITIGCTPCTEYDAENFGVCTLNKELRVVGFNEKPKGNLLKALAMDTSILGLTKDEAAAKPYAANMGVYVFKKQVLLDLLKEQPTACDFSRDIITHSISSMDDFDEPTGPLLNIMAYPFRGYWRDVGSMKSYFEANLDTTVPNGVSFPLRLRDKPLYTEARVLAPAKMTKCEIQDTVVGHGSVLRGCSVTRSVLGDCTTIREGSIVENSIIIGAVRHAGHDDEDGTDRPLLGIGQNCRLHNVIVDRDARIGNNCTIVNEAGVLEANHEDLGYCIREGIVCILRSATIPPGTTI